MNRLILRAGQLLDVLIYGIPVTVKLLMKNPHTVYYILHVGIGDYCTALGYLNAYKSYHGVEHITLVITASRKEICSFYSGYDDIEILPKHAFTGLVFLASLPVARYIHLCNSRIENVSYTLHMNKALLFNNPALHVKLCTRLILKIPEKSRFDLPVVPDVDITRFIEKYLLKRDRTILLNPFTGKDGGVEELDDSFYRLLAAELKRESFAVATILGNPTQKPVDGTEGILTSLAEAWHLAKWCGWVIGTRSGFFDFVQDSGCNIIALYSMNYRQRDFFALRPHSEKGNILELDYEEDTKELIDKIIEFVLQHG